MVDSGWKETRVVCAHLRQPNKLPMAHVCKRAPDALPNPVILAYGRMANGLAGPIIVCFDILRKAYNLSCR
jgi:hypothetical protein